MDTRLLYTGLVVAMAAVRLVELRISNRNTRSCLARGGFEAGAGHYPWMVAQHAAFLAACLLEVWLLDRPFVPALAAAMLLLLGGAAALRWWAITALGERWTTRILCLPGTPPVEGGPYRFVRHPNYLAVVVEIAALPLVHGAWWTALAFSLANAALLRVRIAAEEAALSGASGYGRAFAGRPRFLPRWR